MIDEDVNALDSEQQPVQCRSKTSSVASDIAAGDDNRVMQEGTLLDATVPLDKRTHAIRQHSFTFRKPTWAPSVPSLSKVIEVYFHSDDLMVINKPADFIIDGDEWSVQEYLQREYPQYPLFHLIHQIDYATSGVQCLGLNKRTSARVCRLFSDRLVHKEYVAIVRGWLEDQRCASRLDTAHTVVHVAKRGWYMPPPAGAHLDLSPDQVVTSPVPVTLVHLHLLTGRRHQLRVHLASLGHPIVGDNAYEGAPPAGTPAQISEHWPYTLMMQAPRMYLHSHYIHLPLRKFVSRDVRVWNYDLSVHIPSAFDADVVCGCWIGRQCRCPDNVGVDNIARWEKERETLLQTEAKEAVERKLRTAAIAERVSKRKARRLARQENKVTNVQ
ncbi:hypothetical protein RI367_002784 [Sorochytrium milnesiophthora]